MTRTEELILKSQSGDREALDRLIEENNGLIWSIARRFVGRGTDLEDLYQLGCVGFLKAAEGFDLEFGTQFSTYAVPKISGEIRRFLRDDGPVKVSRSLKEQAYSIKNAQQELVQALGREPTVSEISGVTGFSPEEIAAAEVATQNVESIQSTSGEEGFTLESVLTDPDSEEKMLERMALSQALTQLPERERSVIAYRFFHGLTQEQVARILQVSQVQVSRIEKKAIGSLRELLM